MSQETKADTGFKLGGARKFLPCEKIEQRLATRI